MGCSTAAWKNRLTSSAKNAVACSLPPLRQALLSPLPAPPLAPGPLILRKGPPLPLLSSFFACACGVGEFLSALHVTLPLCVCFLIAADEAGGAQDRTGCGGAASRLISQSPWQ